MTRILLLRSVVIVMVILGLLMAFVTYAHFHSPKNIRCLQTDWGEDCWHATYSLLKEFTAVIIAIPAAWLAYCFNRRNSFLIVLNDLWKGMVISKNLCIKYTFDPSPSNYIDAWLSLSSSIDSMRSVYRNVNESEHNLGYFPFEPLHDMRKTLEALKRQLEDEGTKNSRKTLRSEARARLIDSWNGLRSRFLLEFGAPFPRRPIISRNFKDPRRLPPVAPTALASQPGMRSG